MKWTSVVDVETGRAANQSGFYVSVRALPPLLVCTVTVLMRRKWHVWRSVRCAERRTLPNSQQAALKTDPHSNTGLKKRISWRAGTFEYDPQIKAKPNKSALVRSCAARKLWLSTLATLQRQLKLWEDPATTERWQGFVPQGALNDIHKGWNNRDTIWCVHCEPKFQSSPSPLKSRTFRNIPHIHSFTEWHTSSHLHERQFPASSSPNLPE